MRSTKTLPSNSGECSSVCMNDAYIVLVDQARNVERGDYIVLFKLQINFFCRYAAGTFSCCYLAFLSLVDTDSGHSGTRKSNSTERSTGILQGEVKTLRTLRTPVEDWGLRLRWPPLRYKMLEISLQRLVNLLKSVSRGLNPSLLQFPSKGNEIVYGPLKSRANQTIVTQRV